MPYNLDELVAGPGFAPREWQSGAPPAVFGGAKPPVAMSEDLDRILRLARRGAPDGPRELALVEFAQQRFSRGPRRCECAKIIAELGIPHRECITRLRPVQAWALHEINTSNGLLAPIGVGHGKTILDLLAAMAIRDCRTACLLVPPGLVSQLIADYRLVGEHFHMPQLVIHGHEFRCEIPSRPVLHVFPYSRLSRPESTSMLNRIAPDLIIADEAHKLKDANTATTSRVLRYFRDHGDTRFAAWTGSLTDRSIKEYAHLAALALRMGSPLPIDPDVVEDWARSLDPDSDAPAPPGALLSLCNPGEHIYSGFHRRLVDSPGVVYTLSAAIDAKLEIRERVAPELPVAVSEALNNLRATWMRPDGEVLIDALSMSRCARELACGFFYRWIFPRGEPVDLILEWLDARATWFKELRSKLRDRAEHLDSPLLCTRAAMRAYREHVPSTVVYDESDELDDNGDPILIERTVDDSHLPVWPALHYPRWRDIKDKVQPESEAVWIDDYLARDAAHWALTNRGIVWYSHAAFGKRVAELSGLPLHGGGPNAGKLIAAERGDRSIIASIQSHGTGRDGLQRIFDDQLVANPPGSPNTWEQMLGRLHRIGQLSRVVRASYYAHTPELRDAYDNASRRAVYVEGTLGNEQKLRAGRQTE